MITPSSPAWFRALLAAALLSVAACQQAPVATPGPSAAAPLPVPPANALRFAVNTEDSDLRVIVYRGGPLAQFGHNHVLRAGDLRGDVYVAPDISHSSFAIAFSPAAFIVDPEDARAEEGPDFARQPSPEAIAGTRTNMLGPKLLDAARFPEVTLRSVSIRGPGSHAIVTARVGLHGVERDLGFPVAIERGTDRLVATGILLLNTSDFGIPAFAVMGGGLKVEEEVKIKFRIVATRQER